MRLSRNSVAAGALALALVAAGTPYLVLAQSQDSPESILPPGFGDPAPTPTPAPRASDSASVPAGSGSNDAEPASTPTAIDKPADDAAALEAPIDPKLLAQYELPGYARRSTALVGIVDAASGGLAPTAFGAADGRFLQSLMQRLRAPVASRWVSIGLRRALVSQVATPARVNGADFTADRAWLLLRMGESTLSRALIQRVDGDRYTPKLAEVAMQAALANGDPAMVCPVVERGRGMSRDHAWVLADAMCAGLSGRGTETAAALKTAQRSGAARGIDLLLAQRVVGVGGKGQGSVTIEWENVDRLTLWRYGLAMATGVEIPGALLANTSPASRLWRAQAGGLTPLARAVVAEQAAAQGVLSHAALVDLYGQVESEDDQTVAEIGIARDLRTAHVGADRDARLVALRTLWDEPKAPSARYGRLVLTASAAATILPYRDAPDADRLVAAMLSAGLESQALRWRDSVADGSDAWAMLALTGGERVRGSAVDRYRSRASDPTGIKARMLLAGLAGLGQIDRRDADRLAGSLDVDLALENSWTRAITRAGERGQPATVLLLAGVGMQTTDWRGVSPEALYHIVAALRRVGLDSVGRMVAVEALTRL